MIWSFIGSVICDADTETNRHYINTIDRFMGTVRNRLDAITDPSAEYKMNVCFSLKIISELVYQQC